MALWAAADFFQIGQRGSGLGHFVEGFAVGRELGQRSQQLAPGGDLGLVEVDEVVNVVCTVQPVVLGAQQGLYKGIAVADGELLGDKGQRSVDVRLAWVVGRGGGVGVTLQVGLPFPQTGAEVGDQTVFFLAAEFAEEFFVAVHCKTMDGHQRFWLKCFSK